MGAFDHLMGVRGLIPLRQLTFTVSNQFADVHFFHVHISYILSLM